MAGEEIFDTGLPQCVAVDDGVRCPAAGSYGWPLCPEHSMRAGVTNPPPALRLPLSVPPIPERPRANMRGLRRRDWADDWTDALHTMFLDDEGDEDHLFRRVRGALLAAYEAGCRGESLYCVELPAEDGTK